MNIDGPFEIGVVDNEETGVRELHLNFREEYRSLDLDQRVEALAQYIARLGELSADDAGAENYQGMLLVMQVAEQLLPHIMEDEIPLNETVVIELQQQSGLSGLIQGSIMH